MIYQKLLLGEQPYYVFNAGSIRSFEKHRHPEIELCYCQEGNYSIIVNDTAYTVKQGEMMVINSMSAHEIPKNDENCHVLVIEIGPVFLAEYFYALAKVCTNNPILNVDDNPDDTLFTLFQEIINLKKHPGNFSELIIKGNLYKIAAGIFGEVGENCSDNQSANAICQVANIEKALELIRYNYSDVLTVERAALACGYSKSNFCKIFKNITGNTFHNVLNNYRTNMVCVFLRETNYPIETIAGETGFADSKTLCRVFKSFMGITPGEYRKTHLY